MLIELVLSCVYNCWNYIFRTDLLDWKEVFLASISILVCVRICTSALFWMACHFVKLFICLSFSPFEQHIIHVIKNVHFIFNECVMKFANVTLSGWTVVHSCILPVSTRAPGTFKLTREEKNFCVCARFVCVCVRALARMHACMHACVCTFVCVCLRGPLIRFSKNLPS